MTLADLLQGRRQGGEMEASRAGAEMLQQRGSAIAGPYTPPAPPQPSLRSYEPTLIDNVREGLTAFGRFIGHPDPHGVGQRGVAGAMFLPPVAAFSGGQDLAHGYLHGESGKSALGASQIALAGLPALRTFGSRVPARTANPAWSPDEVVRLLRESGAANINARQRGPQGTMYVRFDSPDNPWSRSQRSATGAIPERPTVRIPTDPDRHGGLRPAPGERGGNLFDTGLHTPNWPGDPASTLNAGGGRYSDWENLAAALKWRLSRAPDGQWLISPDQAPQGLREAPLVAPRHFREWWSQLPQAARNRHQQSRSEARDARAVRGPVQERLLSAGAPVLSLADLLQERQWAAAHDYGSAGY